MQFSYARTVVILWRKACLGAALLGLCTETISFAGFLAICCGLFAAQLSLWLAGSLVRCQVAITGVLLQHTM